MGPALYITLILGSLAVIWIIVLSIRLNNTKKALADERRKSSDLAVKLADVKAKLEAKGMTDDELLTDVSDLLSGL